MVEKFPQSTKVKMKENDWLENYRNKHEIKPVLKKIPQSTLVITQENESALIKTNKNRLIKEICGNSHETAFFQG